ncbi:unnamed protein product, partial [Phaeothamnion confervicola]
MPLLVESTSRRKRKTALLFATAALQGAAAAQTGKGKEAPLRRVLPNPPIGGGRDLPLRGRRRESHAHTSSLLLLRGGGGTGGSSFPFGAGQRGQTADVAAAPPKASGFGLSILASALKIIMIPARDALAPIMRRRAGAWLALGGLIVAGAAAASLSRPVLFPGASRRRQPAAGALVRTPRAVVATVLPPEPPAAG